MNRKHTPTIMRSKHLVQFFVAYVIQCIVLVCPVSFNIFIFLPLKIFLNYLIFNEVSYFPLNIVDLYGALVGVGKIEFRKSEGGGEWYNDEEERLVFSLINPEYVLLL